jgi:hypothetical protein
MELLALGRRENFHQHARFSYSPADRLTERQKTG